MRLTTNQIITIRISFLRSKCRLQFTDVTYPLDTFSVSEQEWEGSLLTVFPHAHKRPFSTIHPQIRHLKSIGPTFKACDLSLTRHPFNCGAYSTRDFNSRGVVLTICRIFVDLKTQLWDF